MLDIRCQTYSTSLRPSLVFAGLAVTFFSRSLPSTLRVLSRYSLSVGPCINTSSIYISHMRVKVYLNGYILYKYVLLLYRFGNDIIHDFNRSCSQVGQRDR